MPALCRDCLSELPEGALACPKDAAHRTIAHPELDTLAIVHVDADAFYAAIEKRDNPALADKAVIVGGSRHRGVVLTCCYIARKSGVRSAMPMFEAMRRCPRAVVVPPDMEKYAEAARQIRDLMRAVTPIVEPVSLDEAYLDLSGTQRLHGGSPARTIAGLALRVEREAGITVSAGLSYNKFLAKLASDLKKPRGFAVIGRAEAVAFLRPLPAGAIRGVGPVLQAKLQKDGFERIGQIQDRGAAEMMRRYGDTGLWLHRLAHGEDGRDVEADGESKSISAETTFEADIAGRADLEKILWDQAERVSKRAKAAGLGGRTVTLKLKTAKFRIKTRSASLEHPTQLAHVMFDISCRLLAPEADGTAYRLLGIGISQLQPACDCDPPDLIGGHAARRTAVEHAMDDVRAKFGDAALRKGISKCD